MTEERWAQIPGFPDYAVSDHGRVMSLRYNKFLAPRINSYGHLRVALMRDLERHDVYIQHLVAAAFLQEYEPGDVVKHYDRNNANNHYENLRFRRNKRMGQPVKHPPAPVYRRVRVVGTDLVFRTVEDCARYVGGDPSSIYRVIRGERLSHRGHTFVYEEGTDE